jgi:hypothetical protein
MLAVRRLASYLTGISADLNVNKWVTTSLSGNSGLISKCLGALDDAWISLYSRSSRNTSFGEGWGWFKNDISFSDTPQRITVRWKNEWQHKGSYFIRTGVFCSPITVEEGFHADCTEALFEIMVPSLERNDFPICVQLAATNDQGLWKRRRFIAQPLIDRGIGSVILENAYYGARRPKSFTLPFGALPKVSDLYLMGKATIEEGRSLLRWLREDYGHNGPLGVTGVSMGAAMATAIGCSAPFEVAVASCLPAHSPVPIYTQGVLSKAVRWETLRGEMNFESEDEAKKHMQSFLNLASIDEILKFHRTPFSYVQISAVNDRYIPTDSAQLLYDIVAERCHTHAHELTWIRGGHVSSVLIDRSNIIDAIVRSFKLLKQRQQEQVQEA